MSLPHRPRLSLALLLLAFLGLAAVGPAATAGVDDFEFGQRLAERGYFDLARKVFEGMLADSAATNDDKDAARFGLALLGRSQAERATGSAAPYADVRALFDDAVKQIAAFVEKNPTHPKADEARLSVGTIRLAFVQWAEALLGDPKDIEERQGTADQVREDAKKAVAEAIAYFERLKPKEGEDKPSQMAQIARLNWVMSQYYEALVLPSCSAEAVGAFQDAAAKIEEYITDNDGFLVAIFAQDVLGLVMWKLAACETDTERQVRYYDKAIEWFQTCIDTENVGDDYLKVITSGYYHLGQVCHAAGRLPGRNYLRTGIEVLSKMLDQHPTAWRTDNGLRARIELSKLECANGDAKAAVDIAKDVADRAKADRKPHLERLAARQLGEYISGSCGGASGGRTILSSDPAVLARVAEDLYSQKRLPDAIRAFQNVVASLPDTPQAFVEFGIPAWRRISQIYRQLGDPLAAALALEPIHDAWMDGRIPRKEGDPADANLDLAGNIRREAEALFQELAKTTGSKVFQERYTAIRDAFLVEYKDHRTGRAGAWNSALDSFRQASALKTQKNPDWRRKLDDARGFFRAVAQDPNAQMKDLAWTYLIRAEVMDEKDSEALKVADQAWAFWKSPAAKAEEEKYPDLRARREAAIPEAAYWRGKAASRLGQHDDVIKSLTTYDTDYPNAEKRFVTLVRELLIEAHLAKGEMDAADAHWRKVLATDAQYEGLANIAKRFAGHYNSQYRDIEKEYRELQDKLKGKDGVASKLSKAERAEATASNSIVDKANRLAKLRELIEKYKKDPKNSGIAKGDFESAEKEKPQVEKQIADMQAVSQKASKDAEALRTERDGLQARSDELRQRLYGPLMKAAGYYKQWDDAMKASGAERSASNVQQFAYMFYFASSLRPDVSETWASARDLYEDYLALPKVKELPTADSDKRTAIARLGEIYVHFAERETDPEKRQALVTKAVDFLQNAIALRPENTALVVGMLSGEYVALPWSDPVLERTFRIPVKRVGDVKALRAAVAAIGKPDGTPIPKGGSEADERRYQEALGRFKDFVSKQSDEALEPTAASIKGGGVDWYLYRELADPRQDFRQTLAWAYSESGREEDVPKATSLSGSLIEGPLSAEAGEEIWWAAVTTRLQAYLAAAERAPAGAGAPSATASHWLDRAAQLLKSTAGSYPDLGDEVRPGTRDAWKKILQRLNVLRGKANLPAVVVDLNPPVKTPVPSGGAGGDK